MPRKRWAGEGLFRKKVETFDTAVDTDVEAVQARLARYSSPSADFRGWLELRRQAVEQWLSARPASTALKAGSVDSLARQFLIFTNELDKAAEGGDASSALYWAFECGSVLMKWEATVVADEKLKRQFDRETTDASRTRKSSETKQLRASEWRTVARSLLDADPDLKWKDGTKAARLIRGIWPGDAGEPPSERSIRMFLREERGKL